MLLAQHSTFCASISRIHWLLLHHALEEGHMPHGCASVATASALFRHTAGQGALQVCLAAVEGEAIPTPPVSLLRVRPTSPNRPPWPGLTCSADTMRAPGGACGTRVGCCSCCCCDSAPAVALLLLLCCFLALGSMDLQESTTCHTLLKARP